MRLLRITGLFLAVAAPLAPSHAQERMGPTLAAGLAWGRQSNRVYSTTSWGGFHVALTLPLDQRSAFGAVVLDVSRDVFWKGNGDDCAIRPPANGCVPDPPSLTAATIGWRHALGRSQPVLYVGAGRMSARSEAAGGGVARLTLAPSTFPV